MRNRRHGRAALAATFIKELTNTLSYPQRGRPTGGADQLAALRRHPVRRRGLLVQAALHVGPLTVSQPLLIVIDPIVSIWLSVWLFAEYFTDSAAVIAVAAVAFAGLIVGVVFLTQTAPMQDTAPGFGDQPVGQGREAARDVAAPSL